MFDRLRRAYGTTEQRAKDREVNDLKLLGSLSAVTDRLERAVERIEKAAANHAHE